MNTTRKTGLPKTGLPETGLLPTPSEHKGHKKNKRGAKKIKKNTARMKEKQGQMGSMLTVQIPSSSCLSL
jgi:hypothetical protein